MVDIVDKNINIQMHLGAFLHSTNKKSGDMGLINRKDKVCEKKIIGLLRDYFDKKELISQTKIQLPLLLENINRLENELKASKIDFNYEYVKGQSFDGPAITGSFNTESYIERNMINAFNKKENTINNYKEKYSMLEANLEKLKLDIIDMDICIKSLNPLFQDIVALKYKDKCTNLEISIEMNTSETTVRNHLTLIYDTIGKWLGICF